MSNAREVVAAKTRLQEGLTAAEIRATNWAVVAREIELAIDAGWSGIAVGNAALEGLAWADNVGARVVANIRALAATPPPSTPIPPQYRRELVAVGDAKAGAQAVRQAAHR